MIKEEKVPLKEAAEQVARVCRRLAMLHLAFAKTLVAEFGEEKGKQLILKAIKQYGISIGEEVRQSKCFGVELEPENYVEDLPHYGMQRAWKN